LSITTPGVPSVDWLDVGEALNHDALLDADQVTVNTPGFVTNNVYEPVLP
jgi:hypothetical protein